MSGPDSGSSYLVMNSVDASSLRGWRVALAGGQQLVMNSVGATGLTSVTSGGAVDSLGEDTGGGGGAGDSVATQITGTSDDDDDDVPSSPGSFGEDEGSLQGDDDVTAQLAAAGGWSGPVGVAAAAAIASAKKRKRHHCFELNPSIRKRQKTRLLRKLKATIDEYSTRVGQQAVVVVATPSKSGNDFKCFGAKPLEDVMKTLRQMLMTELENALAQQAPPPPQDDPSLHELPPLIIDGIPTPVEKMTQAQLRAFIPLMLKYSTGRGKPGWGKESTRPPWWPKDVPWANVRMDARSDDQKQKVVSWTTALRQIVINCYKFHGRDDLLPVFNEEEDKSQVAEHMTTDVAPTKRNFPTFQLNLNPQINAQTNSVYSGQMVQTISNPDGTVSIVQVDPSNPVIQLPDGTTAHVQGIAHITTQNGESLDGESGGSAGSVAIDLNQVSEGTLAHEGTILLTGEDGSQIPVNVSGSYPVSGMITVPLPVYQTVVANIQGQDGQPLQVVTPLVQVPKLEPGLEGSVEVSAGLNASLDASTIISSGPGQVQPLKIVKPRTLSTVSFKEDDDDDGSVDMVDKE
ncbi:DNA-binding protein Ewg-like isoform X3 [Eriocheir sinensis]|uniref:DNA-binding protein Ewg-like isoform X3 n=1 Tax=Eriocheir sinensis TaxID=95602 RepID=UPI0021CA05DE|nr:DNA-binding protein Ewg-like isoform X3 [Eriocheir sinensis]